MRFPTRSAQGHTNVRFPTWLSSVVTSSRNVVCRDDDAAVPRVFALVIGINAYLSDPLQGCVTDAKEMERFLKEKLHVPGSRLITLFDEQATGEAIPSTFRKHFIENENIRKGDVMIFYFAGHGTQEYAPEEWHIDGEVVECICPQDCDFDLQHGIPSVILNGLMRELADRKGDNITAIFDCCHSGAMTRELCDRDLRKARYMPPPKGARPTLPVSLHGETMDYWPRLQSAGRAAQTAIPPGFYYDTLQSHVLLSACRRDEQAQEVTTPRGTSRGWFTVNLLARLNKIDSGMDGITYSYLLEESFPRVDWQHPQCLGKHRNRMLWSTASGEVEGFRVSRKENTLVVHAGKVHGVSLRTKFSVHQHGQSGVPLGTLVVRHLDDLRCECQLDSKDPELTTTNGARAVVVEWNNEVNLQVFVPPDVAEVGSLIDSSPHETFIVRASSETQADIAVRRSAGGVTLLERLDPLMRRYSPLLSVNLNGADMRKVFETICHFNFHLYRQPNRSWPDMPDVSVGLYKLRKEEKGKGIQMFVPEGDTNLFCHEVDVTAHSPSEKPALKEAVITDFEPFYGLNLVNRSNCDLFPYLFYFDPNDYCIQCWYHPESPTMSAPLEQNSSLKVGHGAREAGLQRSIKLSLPPGVSSDTGFVKLFVTTEYVDMHCVEQLVAIGSPRVTKPPEQGRQADVWGVWTYVLTCSAPGS